MSQHLGEAERLFAVMKLLSDAREQLVPIASRLQRLGIEAGEHHLRATALPPPHVEEEKAAFSVCRAFGHDYQPNGPVIQCARCSAVKGDEPFVSASCKGERCSMCGAPATAKVGEEIAHDDPFPNRHNYTAYVCAEHFAMVLFGKKEEKAAGEAEVSDSFPNISAEAFRAYTAEIHKRPGREWALLTDQERLTVIHVYAAGKASAAREVETLRDLVAERVLFAFHIYSGYKVESRGPAGCLVDMLKAARPDIAKRLHEEEEPRDLHDEYFGETEPEMRPEKA